ncbi:MAG: hypothetical protein KDC07_10795, partial [Chitinophagaceae bacterium]|nr:hypothetical protein [Chitinophagaceae bacterium]
YIANLWLSELPTAYYNIYRTAPSVLTSEQLNEANFKFIALAIGVLAVAVAGGYYFTWQKTKKTGGSFWNSASKRMLWHMAVPLAAGGLFSLIFLRNGHEMYIAPTCLVFYGLALLNGSKYTVSDIKYLGLSELALGCINLFIPGYGLTCWAIGFGVLHILYGIIMWNRYDNIKQR